MSPEIQSIDDISKHIRGITIYSECDDPTVMQVFHEEEQRLGLSGIALLTPEILPQDKYSCTFPSAVLWDEEDGYVVKLRVPPKSEEKQRITVPIRAALRLEFPFRSYSGIVRQLMRHELTHVKLGHLEVAEGMPTPLLYAYNAFVADPLVNLYNLFRR